MGRSTLSSWLRSYFRLVLTLLSLIFLLITIPFPKSSTPPETDDETKQLNTTNVFIWQTAPDTRSTYSIISSCVLTCALCMWSAIHLNVPRKSRAKWQWAVKCLWLLCSMLYPGIITYQALGQNVLARGLSEPVGNILTSQENSTRENHNEPSSGEIQVTSGWRNPLHLTRRKQRDQKADRKNGRGWRDWFRCSEPKLADIEINLKIPRSLAKETEWSLTHGFYVLMGGLALEINPCDEQFLPNDVTRLALTAKGTKFLAVHAPEMIPTLPPRSEIEDKSKAGSVSKAFACLQVLWFGMQCIERYIQKSPIILLEVVTMAHCTSALIIHCLWWRKPFSVEEPTTRIINGEKMRAILAYMCMSSTTGCTFQAGFIPEDNSVAEFASIRFCRGMVDREALPEAISFCSQPHKSKNAKATLECTTANSSYSEPQFSIVADNSNPASNTNESTGETVSTFKNCTALKTPRVEIPKRMCSQEHRVDRRYCKCCGISMARSQVPHNIFFNRMIQPSNAVLVTLLPGQYLSNAGFCLHPNGPRFKCIDATGLSAPLEENQMKIYLEKHDINRWSLASLAITKYGLPAPSTENLNYVLLEASSVPFLGIPQTYMMKFFWTIALINVLENLIYFIAWNYSFINHETSQNGIRLIQTLILLSFTPSIVVFVYFGMFNSLRAVYNRLFNSRREVSLNQQSELETKQTVKILKVMIYIAFGFFSCAAFLSYILSKFGLLFEAVADVFYLSMEAYQVAHWTNNFPHIL